MSDNKGRKDLEVEIFNRFSRIVKEKFASLADDGSRGGDKMNQIDTLYKQPEFSAEKRILNEMNGAGLYKGVMSGLACFAFLRLSPRAISGVLRRRAGIGREGAANPFNKSSGYKFEPPPGTQQPDNPERPGLLFRFFRLSLDTLVSLSIGAYASMYFADTNKLMNQFANIPLVEGRSILSEELCEDFTKEFQKFGRQTWDSKHSAFQTGTHSDRDEYTTFRQTIQGFVVNCKRREIYQEELRKERGATNYDPVSIPPPGVPKDISLTLDELLGDNDGIDGMDDAHMESGEQFFDEYFGTDEEDRD